MKKILIAFVFGFALYCGWKIQKHSMRLYNYDTADEFDGLPEAVERYYNG